MPYTNIKNAMHLVSMDRARFQRTFIREWRNYRGLTQSQLGERVGVTHATISRIERGGQPYKQPLLEAIADALRTDPASLLMRNPSDTEALWSIWDQATPGERQTIVSIAKTITQKTGT